MYKKYLHLFIVSLFFVLLSAEEPGFKGIHQLQREAHPREAGTYALNKYLAADVIPLQKRESESSGLSHTVFGYLPYWERNSAPEYFDYDVLSHIALFDFSISTDGRITGVPAGWPGDWINTMNNAHANGVKLIMCVVEFNNDNISALINSRTASQTFYEEVEAMINTYNLDGVNIDFEGLHTSDRGDSINNFMQGLSDHIHSNAGPEQEISFAGPAVNWSSWDLPGLTEACDYVFIMGYNYWWSGSSTTGPCAPIEGANYNLVQTLINTDRGYGSCDPARLILGLPYYGLYWEVAQSERDTENAETLSSGKSIFYASAKNKFETHGTIWSGRYEDSWTYYKNDNKWYQVWCSNAAAMDAKEKLVFSHDLMGTGMWALGYDNENPELWELLRNNFYQMPDTLMMDNFEGSCGHFYRHPAYSGSTHGIASSSSADSSRDTAHKGEYSLKIRLNDDAGSAADWKVRLLSGSGSPQNNVRIPHDREIRFALKTGQSGAGVAVLIDDREGELEVSQRQDVIADNAWHEYAVDLRPAENWSPYAGGNGSIDADVVTLDALLFYSPDQPEERIIYLDAVQGIHRPDTLTFTVSGYVRQNGSGIPGVWIADTLTDASGYFEQQYPYNTSLLLIPEKDEWNFSPAQYDIPRINRDSCFYFDAWGTDIAFQAENFSLLPNYPNPFNARTALRFHLPLQGKIHISIYDLSGKYIATPVDKTLPKGEHTEIWDAGTVSSGMYIALMRVNGEIVDSRKLLLVR